MLQETSPPEGIEKFLLEQSYKQSSYRAPAALYSTCQVYTTACQTGKKMEVFASNIKQTNCPPLEKEDQKTLKTWQHTVPMSSKHTRAGKKVKVREVDPRTQLPLTDQQLCIMGNHTSLGTKTVLVTLQLILLINNRTVYEPEIWDQIEVKVWDSATKNDKVAVGLLGTWQAFSEALKSPVGPQSEMCGLPDMITATQPAPAPKHSPCRVQGASRPEQRKPMLQGGKLH
ncbi:hypothetical protein Anapl_17196 [Anas platyrhynchos]|uniref:Uncharacterized protein n=1 Tax=Anas platyrhynchos TaxID=8839 RepID=R0KLQ5_ANAPL|nr:hypothetical protein Anapl_17196 [Anas platyrhynchos]